MNESNSIFVVDHDYHYERIGKIYTTSIKSSQKMAPGNKRRSHVWNHFTRDGTSGKCHYCKKSVSMSAGSSGNLNRHLKLKHPDIADLGLEEFVKLEGANCEVVELFNKNDEEPAENIQKDNPDYEVVIEGIGNNDEVEYQVTKITPMGANKSPSPISNPDSARKGKITKKKIPLVKKDIRLIKTKSFGNTNNIPTIDNNSNSDDIVKLYYEQKIKSAEAKALFYQSMVDHMAKKSQFDQQTHLNILRTLASLNSAAEATAKAMNKLTNSFTVQREES